MVVPYIVGGCVRDSLLGKEPKDWDICTSATPQEIKEHLNRCGIRTIDTGLKHGTVTADMGQAGQYEITTFRIDGDYSDNRHPDFVTFTESIYQDLSRRDFTINAMAYNSTGLIDPFHGVDDLKNGIIRCVGNPNDRFGEDALRILRALRFASVYGFTIEGATAQAIHDNAWRLTNIAAERIRSELCKMLLGSGALPILLDYSDVIATIIPEIKPCIGFDQNNKYHQYTVYEHIAHAVSNYTGGDIAVKVALLLHDIGKPQCYTEDENGGHFHGHGIQSHDVAERVLDRLRFDNKTKQEVLELVLYEENNNDVLVSADMTWTWVNNDNPDERVDVDWALVGQQGDASQAFGSGLTYSSRYFLLKFFNIATPDADPDAFRSKQRAAEAAEDKMIAEQIIQSFDDNSMRYVWWKCAFGHSRRDRISDRTIEHKRCPSCEADFDAVLPQLLVSYYAK